MINVLKDQLATDISSGIQLPKEQVYQALENPKSIENGHLAFPVFMLAKELKKAPPVIAQELKAKLDGKVSNVDQITATGGYLNFTFNLKYLQNLLSKAVADAASGRTLI